MSGDRLSPVFRTPLTDIGDDYMNHQLMGECAKFELRAMECLEAYGLDRGKKKCFDLLSDLRECTYKDKQKARIEMMHIQKMKKFKDGTMDPKSTANDPQIGSFG